MPRAMVKQILQPSRTYGNQEKVADSCISSADIKGEALDACLCIMGALKTKTPKTLKTPTKKVTQNPQFG